MTPGIYLSDLWYCWGRFQNHILWWCHRFFVMRCHGFRWWYGITHDAINYRHNGCYVIWTVISSGCNLTIMENSNESFLFVNTRNIATVKWKNWILSLLYLMLSIPHSKLFPLLGNYLPYVSRPYFLHSLCLL